MRLRGITNIQDFHYFFHQEILSLVNRIFPVSPWAARSGLMPPLRRLGEGKKCYSLNRQTQQGLNHTKTQNIQRSAFFRSLYVQWCRKTAHLLNQLCLMVCWYLTDFRPTNSTTPSEEAEIDHSFLGCCQTQTLPLHLICKCAPVLLHWLQILESNGNILFPTAEEKHLFCLVESNFKSPVTGLSDEGVEMHLQTVSTC